MKIYIRRIDKQCTDKQISILKETLKYFFDGEQSVKVKGKKSNYSDNVSLLTATDPRLGDGIKKIIKAEGDMEIGDLMVITKARNKYTLEIVKPSDDKFNFLINLFDGDERHLELILEDEDDIEESNLEEYTKDDFLNDVFLSSEEYDRLVNQLERKKNLILEGAPGVGKTYAAKRLAYSIIGKKDANKVMLIQFHQSYSYEDFIEGFRPSKDNNGFEIRKGVFYNFCKKAALDSENKYFFIIDEINRGNISKIFGELFMLIEIDKRGEKLQLLYSDEKFNVPPNVYIIGMMNTADRSLAMLDYALRRRFSFYYMRPAFEAEKFMEYQGNLNNQKLNGLINKIKELNEDIVNDPSLGEGFCIGHSYVCNLKSDNISDITIQNIVELEIIPLINEYWFDEPEKIKSWSSALRTAVK